MMQTFFSRKSSSQEDFWLWRTTLIFLTLRIVSLCLHFLGSSPYGGRLVESPERFLFNSIFIEAGVILGLFLLFRLLSWTFGLHGWLLRLPFVLLSSLYLAFAQVDLEFVRWLGEHITLSFIRNYFQATDGHMLGNIILSDKFATFAALFQICLPFGISVWMVRKPWLRPCSRRTWVLGFVAFLLFVSSPMWFMPSEKRWRRIRPVAVSIGVDLGRQFLGLERPKHPRQAYADLIHYVETGHLADQPLDSIPKFPFYHPTGPGKIPAEEFQKLPRSLRPNIVYITFETWRGWKTGLVHDTTLPSYTPILDSIIEHEAYYFPYTHSLGFPSVEGTQNIHLGTWPHFNKIVISSYLNDRWKSLPEIFHDLGYQTKIIVGADPSFSNLTPWFTRWYQDTEYSEAYTQDGPLIDRFIQELDTINRDIPFFLMTWTVTTHPPYTIPESEGIPIAKTDDERYNQALRYAEKQIVRLIDHLKKSDLWDNTIIVIVGDHAQPETHARNNTDVAGPFTPGHTWVHTAFLGGWPGLPKPQRNEETVPSIDIAPTLLEMVNASAPNHFMGHSMLHPQSREFLSFRWNTVALHRENERLLFDMFANSEMWFKLDKSNKRDYALLSGHHAVHRDTPPWSFDKERYRDMILAFGELLDQDRIFPRDERRRGVYVHK
ncbi:MAG TPA: LTA synthase family protein [Fibrobacteraceae bacterium]|nr:LTA synthase family protein [Fibrobacteraceae bacterium]